MQRLIDADALIDAYCNGCTHYRDKICRAAQRCDFESFCNEYINTMPTIDAVPVIRCKDCIHCADDWNGNQPTFTCELGRAGESVQPNDYCSYAERRGEE